MKILIVDDSSYRRNIIRAALEANGFIVSGEVGSGDAAIDMIEELQPDIITLDHILPDMTGIDILKTIQPEKKPYIIMISTAGQKSVMEEALQLGARHYLVKPFNYGELIEIIKKAG